jgi:hypothetical protein
MSAIPGYKDKGICQLKDGFHGCCCKCVYQMKVYGHPWHYKTMGENLGFYVCTVFDAMDHSRKAVLTGHHGECECFQRIQESKE